MAFKVNEAEHLQGPQIEQKLDSTFIDYRFFVVQAT